MGEVCALRTYETHSLKSRKILHIAKHRLTDALTIYPQFLPAQGKGKDGDVLKLSNVMKKIKKSSKKDGEQEVSGKSRRIPQSGC